VLLCWLAPTIAGAAGIADAIDILDPTLTKTVLRETSQIQEPQYCAVLPIPWECEAAAGFPSTGVTLGQDAAGNGYFVGSGQGNAGDGRYTVPLQRLGPTLTTQNVALLIKDICISLTCAAPRRDFRLAGTPSHYLFGLDVVNGRILLGVRAMEYSAGTMDLVDDRIGVVEIAGFQKLFDTLLTFIPGQQAMNILTPAHPDGFRSADSLQVWTGDVRSMPDLSQAEPLTCEAATNPVPGQLVSIPDTLPNPAIGEGRYYLVASQSGADRRLGRQYINGAFSAREPTGLPVCPRSLPGR